MKRWLFEIVTSLAVGAGLVFTAYHFQREGFMQACYFFYDVGFIFKAGDLENFCQRSYEASKNGGEYVKPK